MRYTENADFSFRTQLRDAFGVGTMARFRSLISRFYVAFFLPVILDSQQLRRFDIDFSLWLKFVFSVKLFVYLRTMRDQF